MAKVVSSFATTSVMYNLFCWNDTLSFDKIFITSNKTTDVSQTSRIVVVSEFPNFTSGSSFMLQVHNSSDIVLLQGSNSAVATCQPPRLLQTAVIDRIFIDDIGNFIALSSSFWRIIIKLVSLFHCILKCWKVRAPLHSIKYGQFQFVSYTVDDA